MEKKNKSSIEHKETADIFTFSPVSYFKFYN
jgi:hypothetical protein